MTTVIRRRRGQRPCGLTRPCSTRTRQCPTSHGLAERQTAIALSKACARGAAIRLFTRNQREIHHGKVFHCMVAGRARLRSAARLDAFLMMDEPRSGSTTCADTSEPCEPVSVTGNGPGHVCPTTTKNPALARVARTTSASSKQRRIWIAAWWVPAMGRHSKLLNSRALKRTVTAKGVRFRMLHEETRDDMPYSASGAPYRQDARG